MPYIVIEDFKGGLDTRRMELTAPSGSLQQFSNGHITRGGEIEKAKAFVPEITLPAGTFGFAAVKEMLFVFGSGTTPGGLDPSVTYIRLQTPENANMLSVDMIEPFAGKLFVIASFDDGNQYEFYDGVLDVNWIEGIVRSSMTNLSGVASAFAGYVAADAGAEISVSASGAVLTITSLTNNAPFTIEATATNGGSVDDQSIAVVQTQAAGMSQPQINTATFGGTFDPGDAFNITVNDREYGANRVTGQKVSAIKTHKNKLYAASGINVFFSGVATPALWNVQAVGAGVIDMSSQVSSGIDGITALGIYQNLLAVFARFVTQIWSMDPDPGANVLLQVIDNIGTRSPDSIQAYGDSDTFFLHDSGVRSLRARSVTNQATDSDIGTPIDTLILAQMAGLTDEQIEKARSIIEPQDGRYLLALDVIMYVFSFFRSSEVSSWSTYTRGLVVDRFARVGDRVYARCGDIIYLLGGTNNDDYTLAPGEAVVVAFPYITADKIATWKQWSHLEAAIQGNWLIEYNTNPDYPDLYETIANINRSTYGKAKIGMATKSPLIKLRFTNTDNAYAKLGNVAIHFRARKED